MTESKSVTYESDRERTLVIEGEDIVLNARGRKIDTLPGTSLIFKREDRVPTALVTEGETKVKGKKRTVAHVNGEPQGLTFAELTKALDEHPGRGTMFWEAEKPAEPKSKPKAKDADKKAASDGDSD